MAQATAWAWAVSPNASASGGFHVGGIATDAGGNVYMTGDMLGTVRFGSIILSPTTTGSYLRAFVAKLSPTGTWLWAVQANSPTGSVYGAAVAVSRDGSTVYVAGDVGGAATFGGTTVSQTNGVDPYVARLNATTGTWLSAVRAGGTDYVYTTAMTLDGSDNAYITGYFSRNATFGSTSFTSTSRAENTYVAKMNPQGTWQWAAHGIQTGSGRGYALAADAARNVYLGGQFYGTASFGTAQITSIGGDDMYVAKLNDQGVWQWAAQAGGYSNEGVRGIIADAAGNVTLSGASISTSVTIGSTTLANPGTFLAQADASTGAWRWAVRGPQLGADLALDTNGNVVTAGSFFGNYTFAGTFSSTISVVATDGRMFVGRISPAGIWQSISHLPGTEIVGNFALDQAGHAYLNGNFYGPSATFGTTTLPSSSYYSSYYLAKMQDIALGVRQGSSHYTLTVYPNPAHETVRVKLPEGAGVGRIRLVDFLGRTVREQTVQAADTEGRFSVVGLPAGLYQPCFETKYGTIRAAALQVE